MPSFTATGFQGRRLIRNPSQRMGAGVKIGAARRASGDTSFRLGSALNKTLPAIATKIMPFAMKRATPIGAGFMLANKGLEKMGMGSWVKPRKAE